MDPLLLYESNSSAVLSGNSAKGDENQLCLCLCRALSMQGFIMHWNLRSIRTECCSSCHEHKGLGAIHFSSKGSWTRGSSFTPIGLDLPISFCSTSTSRLILLDVFQNQFLKVAQCSTDKSTLPVSTEIYRALCEPQKTLSTNYTAE